MRHVISAAAAFDIAPLAKQLAGSAAPIADPARELVQRYGYQTLYEVPRELQKRLRRELIRGHAERLQSSPDAVFDHSVFVYLADWMRWLWSETPTEEWEAVLVEAMPAVMRSDRIHHVVAAPRGGYDGYHWLDLRNAKQADTLMRGLYRQFDCESRVVEVKLAP